MSTNIYAYTPAGSNYPPYVSINLATDNGDEVEITVRSEAKENGSCGDTASIKMSSSQFQKLAHDAFSFACTNRA